MEFLKSFIDGANGLLRTIITLLFVLAFFSSLIEGTLTLSGFCWGLFFWGLLSINPVLFLGAFWAGTKIGKQ